MLHLRSDSPTGTFLEGQGAQSSLCRPTLPAGAQEEGERASQGEERRILLTAASPL